MTFRTYRAALLAVACLAAPALTPAAGQTPKAPPAAPAKAITSANDLSDQQMDELFCIYDSMGLDKDAPAVGDAILGDKTKAAVAKQVYDKARAACVTKYTWSAEKAGVASAVASAAATTDVVEATLTDKGYDDKKFESVLSVTDKVTNEDMDKLLYDGEKIEEAVLGRIRTALTSAGVSTDTLELSVAFLQSSLQEYDAVMHWVDMKYY